MGIQARGGIKSIQRLAVTITSSNFQATGTIAAVNTAKTQLRMVGINGSSSNGNLEDTNCRAWLNSATEVAITRGVSGVYAMTATIEVTEWY
jgi:hypothetical protein